MIEVDWHRCEEILPDAEEVAMYRLYYGEDPMYLVVIEDALLPTTLYFDGKSWYSLHPPAERLDYVVTDWTELPPIPTWRSQQSSTIVDS